MSVVVWRRSMVQLVRHRQTKESATDRLNLNHRAAPRLHKLAIHRNGEPENLVGPSYRNVPFDSTSLASSEPS
jgi:hypothetical protein